MLTRYHGAVEAKDEHVGGRASHPDFEQRGFLRWGSAEDFCLEKGVLRHEPLELTRGGLKMNLKVLSFKLAFTGSPFLGL